MTPGLVAVAAWLGVGLTTAAVLRSPGDGPGEVLVITLFGPLSILRWIGLASAVDREEP